LNSGVMTTVMKTLETGLTTNEGAGFRFALRSG